MGWQSFVDFGRADESLVAKRLVATKGGRVDYATQDEDINDHVDLWWTTEDGRRLGIDVKGMKKKSRIDSSPDNDITWLEFKNVLGRPGWLYGKAAYIAFRRIGYTVFVCRAAVVAFGENLIRGRAVSTSRPSQCGIPYTRSKWGREDLTTMVRLDDIEHMSEFTVQDD